MERYYLFIIHLLVIFFSVDLNCCSTETIVHIGVVLDLDSPLGSMADLCMKMAIQDFYSAHPNYKTRLQLHNKNAKTVVDANFAVIDLLKDEQVVGILGPQKDTENEFFTKLGGKVQVPIVSFTARSSALPFEDNRYSVRTTVDDGAQAQALAAICRKFGWSEVVFLCEETDYGNQFLSHLNKALQDIDIGLAYTVSVPVWATDTSILEILRMLSRKQTRVFLVHMNPSLGYRLFTLAKTLGVMSEGYAWIISDSLSNFLNSVDYVIRDSTEGVLGVRPYVNRSKELENLKERYKRNTLSKNPTGPTMELNVYGLWAYDAVTALATAAEKISTLSARSLNKVINGTNNTNLRISRFGPELLTELSRTRFRGVAGNFELINGTLKQSMFEIFNVHGSGEKTIGFWTAEMGITRELSLSGEGTYSKLTELKRVVWPGDSLKRPNGWAIPINLRVGVPWKSGFKEFVNIEVDNATHKLLNVTGFAIDIFLESVKLLPFSINHAFHCYNGSNTSEWTYDDMLNHIPEKFDMVVGDTTIWAPRTDRVDFSLPFSESGIILVVKNKKPFDMWTFTRPLRWDLWLAIIVACILMGIVLRILEHRVAGEDPIRAPMVKPGNIYLSPVTVLAFPERNMVANNWAFFVLVSWLFMAFILMQSYTANLSAILTVDRLKFAFSDDYYIGVQTLSFMKHFLTEKLHISETRLRNYSSAEEYHNAMSLGSKKGGIDAIFDEVPYMKLFLNKYDDSYKMVGPTYRTGGFGFVFPVGSPLVSHFSKAIVDVTQGPNMTSIEQANFGPGYSSLDPLSSTISQGASGLTLYDFAGLFLIIGSVLVFSLFCSETSIGQKCTENVQRFLGSLVCFKRPGVTAVDSTCIVGDFAVGSMEMQESRQSNLSPVTAEEGTNALVSEQVQEHVTGQVQEHVSGQAGEFNSGDVDHETSSSGETSNQDLGSRLDNGAGT